MNLVYLAGPITGLTYDGCTEWRDIVKEQVGEHINTISPMRGKQRLKEIMNNEVIKDCHDYDYLASIKGINCRNFWDVQRCSIVFVNFLGANKISIGTIMEIAWARAFNKPVICVMETDNIHSHSMLNFSCGYIVPTLDIGIDILKALLLTDKQNDNLFQQTVKQKYNNIPTEHMKISYEHMTINNQNVKDSLFIKNNIGDIIM